MVTATDRLVQLAEEIKSGLTDLLLNHSSVHEFENDPDSSFVWLGPPYFWNPLGTEGRRLQSRILEEYRHFWELLWVLMLHQPGTVLTRLEEAKQVILEMVEQPNTGGWVPTAAQALVKATEALETQVSELNHLYDAGSGEAILVPDTNALLFNPQLEDWEFSDLGPFTVVLTPTVLSELDQLKVIHRDEAFRKKVEGVIRRIKGYRGRGRLLEGVVLRKDRSTLISVATEPDLSKSLPWLDADNADDRLIAATIEVMRKYPRSPVFLVTRDINLQNKAEHAGLLFKEPPDSLSA